MEPMEVVFGVAMTLVGGVISWLASWYYYFRARPERTSVDAIVRAAHKQAQKPIDGNPKNAPNVPLQMVLEVIAAFEQHKIYVPELFLCAKAYKTVGDILNETICAVEAAGASAGPMLSPSWQSAREKAMTEGLAKAKDEIMRRVRKGQA